MVWQAGRLESYQNTSDFKCFFLTCWRHGMARMAIRVLDRQKHGASLLGEITKWLLRFSGDHHLTTPDTAIPVDPAPALLLRQNSLPQPSPPPSPLPLQSSSPPLSAPSCRWPSSPPLSSCRCCGRRRVFCCRFVDCCLFVPPLPL